MPVSWKLICCRGLEPVLEIGAGLGILFEHHSVDGNTTVVALVLV